MVLIRSIVEVEYGHFGDVMRCYEELNAVCEARGWQPAKLRVAAGAKANVLAADVEYPSLSAWEAEQDAAYTDAEYMKVLRDAAPYCVQGTATEQIWMDAPHLA